MLYHVYISSWLTYLQPDRLSLPPSVSRLGQGMNSSVCLAVLPATTTMRAPSTGKGPTVNPALQLKTLDRRWTVSLKRNPAPAAAALGLLRQWQQHLRGVKQRASHLFVEMLLNVEERMMMHTRRRETHRRVRKIKSGQKG